MSWIKRRLTGLWQRLCVPFPIKLIVVEGDLFPARVPKRRLVLLDDDGPYAAAMLCPCGCGENIELTLMKGVRPRWDLRVNAQDRPTLYPSVWRQSGCYSHFWLSEGRVVWCKPERT